MSDKKVFCPILGHEISQGYCWDICNIGSDDILLHGDKIADWDKAAEICNTCGYWDND